MATDIANTQVNSQVNRPKTVVKKVIFKGEIAQREIKNVEEGTSFNKSICKIEFQGKTRLVKTTLNVNPEDAKRLKVGEEILVTFTWSEDYKRYLLSYSPVPPEYAGKGSEWADEIEED